MKAWLRFFALVWFALTPAVALAGPGHDDSSHALISPQKWGVAWARVYDLAASQRKDPARIVQIGCRRYKTFGYVCQAVLRDVSKPNGPERCVNLLIGDDGTVLAGKRSRCQLVA